MSILSSTQSGAFAVLTEKMLEERSYKKEQKIGGGTKWTSPFTLNLVIQNNTSAPEKFYTESVPGIGKYFVTDYTRLLLVENYFLSVMNFNGKVSREIKQKIKLQNE